MSSADVSSIADDFWGVRYYRNDVKAYQRYLEILRLSNEGHSAASIERVLKTSNVGKYIRGQKRSFLTNLRAQRDRLGRPKKGFQWLPIKLKPRGTPGIDWIQVPKGIQRFQDVLSVLEQRSCTEDALGSMKIFDYKSRRELIREKSDLFGFLLGAIVGDASKPIKGQSRFPSMTIALTLSKNKRNSLRFGRFTSLCASACLGLRMNRIRDAEPSAHRFTDAECYRWVSQSSPLIGWIFRVCLGLKEGETTTRNPLRMNWIMTAPRDFRIHFFQGLAESDGYVDGGRDRVSIVSSPNTRLVLAILKGLGCDSRFYEQPPIERVEIPTVESAKLPIFSPRIHSQLYREMKLMAEARRFHPRKRIPSWFVRRMRAKSVKAANYSQACLILARSTGYKVSGQTVRKYCRA